MPRGTDCKVHVHHSMVPLEMHHIIPKAYGGTNIPENLVRICANGHGDVHFYLSLLFKFQGFVPWDQEKMFGTKVRSLAQRGFVGLKALYHTDPAKLEAIRLVSIRKLEEDPLD